MVLKYFSRLVVNTTFLMAISVGILCSVGDDDNPSPRARRALPKVKLGIPDGGAPSQEHDDTSPGSITWRNQFLLRAAHNNSLGVGDVHSEGEDTAASGRNTADLLPTRSASLGGSSSGSPTPGGSNEGDGHEINEPVSGNSDSVLSNQGTVGADGEVFGLVAAEVVSLPPRKIPLPVNVTSRDTAERLLNPLTPISERGGSAQSRGSVPLSDGGETARSRGSHDRTPDALGRAGSAQSFASIERASPIHEHPPSRGGDVAEEPSPRVTRSRSSQGSDGRGAPGGGVHYGGKYSPAQGIMVKDHPGLSPRAREDLAGGMGYGFVERCSEGAPRIYTGEKTLFQKIFDQDIDGGVVFRNAQIGICISRDIGTISIQSAGPQSIFTRIQSVYLLICPRVAYMGRPDDKVSQVLQECEEVLLDVFREPGAHGFEDCILADSQGKGIRFEDIEAAYSEGFTAEIPVGRLLKENQGSYAMINNHYHKHFIMGSYVISWSIFTELIRLKILGRLAEKNLLMDESSQVIQGDYAKSQYIESQLTLMRKELPPFKVSEYANRTMEDRLAEDIASEDDLISTDPLSKLRPERRRAARYYNTLLAFARKKRFEIGSRKGSLVGVDAEADAALAVALEEFGG